MNRPLTTCTIIFLYLSNPCIMSALTQLNDTSSERFLKYISCQSNFLRRNQIITIQMTLFTIKENNYLHFDISAVLCTMYVETESVTFHKECPYVAKYDCDIMLIAMQIHYSKYISQKKIYQSMNNACI